VLPPEPVPVVVPPPDVEAVPVELHPTSPAVNAIHTAHPRIAITAPRSGLESSRF
jgi:hypothetical protein